MKTFRYITVAACAFVLGGCTSMDQYPEDSMSPETYFSAESELQQYTNSFYELMPTATSHSLNWYMEQGELVTVNLPEDEIMGSRPLPTKSSEVGWTWTTLRDINYFSPVFTPLH